MEDQRMALEVIQYLIWAIPGVIVAVGLLKIIFR